MNIEIERKFLVANDGWKLGVKSANLLRDGLLSSSRESKVRIRIICGNAFITIKSAKTGMTRTEYEYPIAPIDAEAMLANLCEERVCCKTRLVVPCASHIWSVDIYNGVLDGIVIAEIKLTHEEEDFVLPEWIGKEVTHQPEFRKWKMLARRRAALRNEAQLSTSPT
jgi:CYTH domain-containing protein